MHKSLIFFLLPGGEIRWVPRITYVRLLRGEQRMPEFAGHAVRVADWYVVAAADQSLRVDNETYSILAIDGSGSVDWPHGRHGVNANLRFYEALANSNFEDPDDDPAVRAIRTQLGEEFSWFPDETERAGIFALATQVTSQNEE